MTALAISQTITVLSLNWIDSLATGRPRRKRTSNGFSAQIQTARITGRYSRHPKRVSDENAVPNTPRERILSDNSGKRLKYTPCAVSASRKTVRRKMRMDVTTMVKENRVEKECALRRRDRYRAVDRRLKKT